MVLFTLASLGGFLGLHRFYAGRWKSGLLMLMTLGGVFVWWIIDVLILLSGRFQDSRGRFVGPPRRSPIVRRTNPDGDISPDDHR